MRVIEALLDLNKWLFMDGYESDFTIKFGSKDFDRLVEEFKKNYPNMPVPISITGSADRIDLIRLAGPGSYFLIERRK